MGVDTRVHIPPYVHFEQVAKLVAKYCADPELQKNILGVYGEKPQFVDFDKPANQENRWHYRYYDHVKTTSMPTLLQFMYQAFGQIDKQMHFHFDNDTYNTRLLGYKIITARANPLNVAICQKIVEHFGGYIQYSDSTDEHDLRITDKKAVFKKLDWVSDDPDIVFYRLVNSLDAVKPMTVAELEFGKKHSAYAMDEEQEKIVLDWIQVHQDKIMLEKNLDHKTQKPNEKNSIEKFKI